MLIFTFFYVRAVLMSYGFDIALMFTLEQCVQERSGQAESQTKKVPINCLQV